MGTSLLGYYMLEDMMNIHLFEKLTGTNRVFEGKVVNLRIDEVILPTGKRAVREVVEHPGAVAIVPVLQDGAIVMVRQYRHAAGKIMLEIPAGKLNKGENPDSCAMRELEEETGYQASKLRKLSAVYTTPGFTNELIHIYVAEGLNKTLQNTDEDEFIDIVQYDPVELRELITTGKIDDAKTMLGLFLAGIVS